MSSYITLRDENQEYPEYMFYQGKCYRLLDESRRTNYGEDLDRSKMIQYQECGDCQESNPQNTMFVMYEPE